MILDQLDKYHDLTTSLVRFPEHAKKLIKGGMYKEVKGVMSREEFERHFSPPYSPWQQRLCLAPASDFFGAIRDEFGCIISKYSAHQTNFIFGCWVRFGC